MGKKILWGLLIMAYVFWKKGGSRMGKKMLWGLLIMAYVYLILFGFLSGMSSEGLIISLAAVACPVAAMRMKAQPVWRGVLLVLPFILLAAQLILSAVAEKLC
ncbi:MAG: hypothetical protein IKL25_03240 [Clostridia bacterium]|nr:hypothetical protein [Clostridia bacterium]